MALWVLRRIQPAPRRAEGISDGSGAAGRAAGAASSRPSANPKFRNVLRWVVIFSLSPPVRSFIVAPTCGATDAKMWFEYQPLAGIRGSL